MENKPSGKKVPPASKASSEKIIQPDARVVSVNISSRRGTSKKEIPNGYLVENIGLVGDAHAQSDSHRQLSLLAVESVNKMQDKGLKTVPGLFAENINTEGIDLLSLNPGTRISIGKTAILEITQIGKECHSKCAVFTQVGDCVMPREGVFARVIKSGNIQKGDSILRV